MEVPFLPAELRTVGAEVCTPLHHKLNSNLLPSHLLALLLSLITGLLV